MSECIYDCARCSREGSCNEPAEVCGHCETSTDVFYFLKLETGSAIPLCNCCRREVLKYAMKHGGSPRIYTLRHAYSLHLVAYRLNIFAIWDGTAGLEKL